LALVGARYEAVPKSVGEEPPSLADTLITFEWRTVFNYFCAKKAKRLRHLPLATVWTTAMKRCVYRLTYLEVCSVSPGTLVGKLSIIQGIQMNTERLEFEAGDTLTNLR
jgi:hypothetical protein